jgi:proteasome lid subunit RPN8/RPN11
MSLKLPAALLHQIETHGEGAYPLEGAGLMLGDLDGDDRSVSRILPLTNSFEESKQARRYLIDPQAMMDAEDKADRLGLAIVGVFHSHPDHPAQPSEFDRQWALPWFDYLIVSVRSGAAGGSRVWRLSDDRSQFDEITLVLERSEGVT